MAKKKEKEVFDIIIKGRYIQIEAENLSEFLLIVREKYGIIICR